MDESIRNTLLALAKKQILLVLIKKIPFLALPIINPILSFFLGKLLNIIMDQTVLGIRFMKIDWELTSEINDVNRAVDKANKAIKENDLEQIKLSEIELIEAARKLIRIGRTFS